jgi:hypothetical protein
MENNEKTFKEIQKESSGSRRLAAAYIGYFGFGGQIASSTVLVHLPMLEPFVGGKLFSFCLGIATGISGNLVRLLVLIYGRKFTFALRVVLGSILSAIFAFGFYVIYACTDLSRLVDIPPEQQVGFWLGLLIALVGGMGNAQLLTTGYGMASLMSVKNPATNSLFFLGMASASACCWPIKTIMHAIISSNNPGLHLGVIMGITSLISLSIIPVFYFKLRPHTLVTTDKKRITCKDAWRVMKQTYVSNCLLWITLLCTALVTPGQVMLWTLPENSHTSDLKIYLSLCVYLGLLADAFGKLICAALALWENVFKRILDSRWTPRFIILLAVARLVLMPFFYFPPNNGTSRFFILITFGLLHGIIASMSLSLSSHRVAAADSDLAGYLGSFSIVNGLLVGSVAGMLVRLATTS